MIQAAFTAPTLPEGLEALLDLALDLRWTWSHGADHLWRTLDLETWEATRNPWLLLQSSPRERLAARVDDPEFRAALERVLAARRTYLETPPALDVGGGLPLADDRKRPVPPPDHACDRVRVAGYACDIDREYRGREGYIAEGQRFLP